MKLKLYSHDRGDPEKFHGHAWNPWGRQIDDVVARTWLETIDQFD